MNHVGDSAGRKGMGDAGPHCRLRTITQPAVAYPKHRKTSGGGYREAQWPIGPWTTGRRIAPLPGRTPLDNCSSLRAPGGWARLTAGSGRVSGAVAHVSKHELGTRRRGESGSSTGRQVRETRGPPSYAAGRSTDISSLVNMPT